MMPGTLGLAADPSLTSPRACEKCTRSKRRCDKTLPRCGRCNRLDAPCVYEGTGGVKAADPPVLRLDSPPAPPADSTSPRGLCGSSGIDWHHAVTQYFHTVHSWFRVVPQEEFDTILGREHEHIHQPASNEMLLASLDTEEAALLVLCMYLLTQTAGGRTSDDSIFGPVYESTKRHYSVLSSLCNPSLRLIQIGAMLALFDFGHGRAKFAYRTLSGTVALARIVGIKPGSLSEELDPTCREDDGNEDARALWWGLFILDQYIHLDPEVQELPLLVETPHMDDLLPTNGVLWGEQGYSFFKKRVSVNAPKSVHLGTFQRSAQSAVILHDTHVWNSRARKSSAILPVSELSDLFKRIRDLLDAMLRQVHGWEVFCDAFAMCMSSIFILFHPYLRPIIESNSPPQHRTADEDVEQAVTAIRFATQFINDLAISFNNHLEKHPEWLANLAPPATISCCQAAEHIFLLRHILGDNRGGFLEIYKAMKIFSRKWSIGGTMLEHMHRHDDMSKFLMDMESSF